MSRPNIIPLYSYEDYKLWKGDWELIDGHPVAMSPSPIRKHQRVAKNIAFLFDELINKDNNCDCEVLYELDWIVGDKIVLRPDIVVICDDSETEFITKTPSVIIEVLSPSTIDKDTNTKFNIYESEGVLFYIMANPDNHTIEVYELIDKAYQLVASEKNMYQINLDSNCQFNIDLSTIFS